MKTLSLIIPLYNEEKNLILLYNKINEVLKNMEIKYEIIFVDDGSKDNSFLTLKNLTKRDKNIKIIKLKKNFGKSIALQAGFNNSSGEIIITMDSDLQNDPKDIPKFINKMEEGFDLVSGYGSKGSSSITKRTSSKIFNFLTRMISGVKLRDFNSGYKAYKREAIDSIKLYGGHHRYIPILVKMQGFKIGEIEITSHKRIFGKSKYGFGRLFKGFFDLITIKFITTFEKNPLHFFGALGILFLFFGLIFGFYILYIKYILFGSLGIGRPIVILTALCTIAGIQLISTGLIGELLTRKKSTEETKNVFNKQYIKEILK